jgi:hypothetical protein
VIRKDPSKYLIRRCRIIGIRLLKRNGMLKMKNFEDKLMALINKEASDIAHEEIIDILCGDWDDDIALLMKRLRGKLGGHTNIIVFYLFNQLLMEEKIEFTYGFYENDEGKRIADDFKVKPTLYETYENVIQISNKDFGTKMKLNQDELNDNRSK